MVQVHAVLLGVSLVVAVGLAIYTHFTNPRFEQPNYERPRNGYAYDDGYTDYRSGNAAGETRRSAAGPRRKRKLSSCTICLTDMLPTSDLRDLCCGHTFHRKCIEHWLDFVVEFPRSCPNCRARVA